MKKTYFWKLYPIPEEQHRMPSFCDPDEIVFGGLSKEGLLILSKFGKDEQRRMSERYRKLEEKSR